jgi:hypothetical protein
MPTFHNPAKVVVTESGGVTEVVVLLAGLAVLAGAVWAAITYALIIAVILGVSVAVTAAGVWLLHRHCTVIYYNPAAIPARQRTAVAAPETAQVTGWQPKAIAPPRTLRGDVISSTETRQQTGVPHDAA